jgi:2'-5' RNA ligase
MSRHAIYYAPAPGTRLHQLGASWVGRDAFDTHAAKAMSPLGDWADDAARYGFHATLKAPFTLAESQNPSALQLALDAFAQVHRPASSGKLVLRDMDGFLALVPEFQSDALSDLAAACVMHFDPFRRAADEKELARQRKAPLTERQEANLLRWGYPYVLADFRFHMTLSRRLTDAEKSIALPIAQSHFAEVIGQELVVDHLCIFQEPAPLQPFMVQHCAHLKSGKL